MVAMVEDHGDEIAASSRAVDWWTVHVFVDPWLTAFRGWPMVGTPDWCALPDDSPIKWAALLDAAQHWALRLEGRGQACAEASKAISASYDWAAISNEIRQRGDYLAANPWARRKTS